MGLRTLAREVAHNASRRMCGTNDMFQTNFYTLWVDPMRKRNDKKMQKKSSPRRR